MRHSLLIGFTVLILILAACSPALSSGTPDELSNAPQATVTPQKELPTQENVPEATTDAQTTATESAPFPTLIPGEDPTPPELIDEKPPTYAVNEFFTDFDRHLVSYREIQELIPKDAISSLDEPSFISAAEADQTLRPREPVIFIQLGKDARAYPLRILTWHEIVNDTIDGQPIAVTFCPLCNTAIAFQREVDGLTLDFGTTGRLRYSNLIMYDRQTESWWQQATGEAIAGIFTGRQLAAIPAAIIAWEDFRASFPQGKVLSQETGFVRSYGDNPYAGYDDVDNTPFAYAGPLPPDVLLPMERVLTVEINGEAAAYPYTALKEARVINDTVGGQDIVIIWEPGTASALDDSFIPAGREVGAANAFSAVLDDQLLTFNWDGERVNDEQTGSTWNILGIALAGPYKDRQLTPVVSINHFWFSWAAFKPETRVYTP